MILFVSRTIFLGFLALTTTTLWAENLSAAEPLQKEPSLPPLISTPAPAKLSGENKTTFSIGPLLGIPASGKTASEYNVGGGGEIYIGFRFDQNLLFGLELGIQDYSVNPAAFFINIPKTYGITLPAGALITGDFTYVPVMAMARYSFGENKDVRPYALFGMGAAYNGGTATASYNFQTASATLREIDFVMAAGFGVALRADDNVEFFLQGRVDIDFTSNNDSDIITLTQPGTGAFWAGNGNLSDDSPTLFIPIQIGLRILK